MTTTPESWDDVGCLRLQVDCISQKVENVQRGLATFEGLSPLEFQKLRDEVALIHARERCQLKVCGIASVFLLSCILVVLLFIAHSKEAPSLTQRPSGEASIAHLANFSFVNFQAPEATILVPGAEKEKDKQSSVGDISKPRGLQKPVDDAAVMGKPEKEMIADVGLQKPVNNADVARKAEKERAWKLDAAREQHDFAEREVQRLIKMIEVTHDKPSPLSDHSNLLTKSPRGLFWVCFPKSVQKQYVEKYASVFNEVAASRKWNVFPFCWLNHEILSPYGHDEHLCNDVEKTTFVVEMENAHDSDSKHASSQIPSPSKISFRNCEDVGLESPSWLQFDSSSVRFRETLPADQDIQASLVDKFLNDAYSGKLPKIMRMKRDL